MQRNIIVFLAAAGLAASLPTAAAPMLGGIYGGGGLSYNWLDDDGALGYQVFAGFEPVLAGLGPLRLGGELGYRGSGSFDDGGAREGVWAGGHARAALLPGLSVLGRLGWDFGDESGVLYGVGVGHQVNPLLEVRGDFVVRDETDSLQLNLILRY